MTTRLLVIIGIAAALAGCASSGSVPRPFPGARTPQAAPESPVGLSTAVTDAIIMTALDLRGVRYRNGGSDPSGFDCSGFVQWVFSRHGVALPRETSMQFDIGAHVNRGDLLPGDLVFFETVSRGASHVGLVIGPDTFVHAPSERGVVRVEHLSTRYWDTRFVGARRITANSTVRTK